MRYLSADIVFPIDSTPILKGVLLLNDDNSIEGVCHQDEVPSGATKEYYEGALCPGFINSHCHLELSHLYGKIEKGKGMTAFIKELLVNRNLVSEEEQKKIAATFDKQMYDQGIVAVGDIANTNLTASIKKQSKIHYHTFVEAFDIDESKADVVWRNATELLNAFENASIVPHAPYTVSKKLFEFIATQEAGTLISYHHNESADEQEMFKHASGSLLELFKSMGTLIDLPKENERSSTFHTIPFLSAKHRLMLVHNTYANADDIDLIFDRIDNSNVHFCLCPNANLYIENRLPDVNMLRDKECKIVVGTDSLASNDQLSVLEELKVLSQHFPDISLEELMSWATINASNYFNLENELGSFSKGKRPGVVHISNIENGKLTIASQAKRIA